MPPQAVLSFELLATAGEALAHELPGAVDPPPVLRAASLGLEPLVTLVAVEDELPHVTRHLVLVKFPPGVGCELAVPTGQNVSLPFTSDLLDEEGVLSAGAHGETGVPVMLLELVHLEVVDSFEADVAVPAGPPPPALDLGFVPRQESPPPVAMHSLDMVQQVGLSGKLFPTLGADAGRAGSLNLVYFTYVSLQVVTSPKRSGTVLTYEGGLHVFDGVLHEEFLAGKGHSAV